MKIDLDKDEWELIYRMSGHVAAFPVDERQIKNTDSIDSITALKVFKKLGDEWKDEGEA